MTLERRLAKRIREQLPELSAGRVDAVFEDQLEDIIREFMEDENNDTTREHAEDI